MFVGRTMSCWAVVISILAAGSAFAQDPAAPEQPAIQVEQVPPPPPVQPAPPPSVAVEPAAPPATAPAGPAPRARVPEPTFEFPEAWSGDKIEHGFEVCNDGDGVLQILEVRAGCGCTAIPGYDKQVEKGKCTIIKATLSTARMQGKLNKQIYVRTNDPQQQQITLTLTGDVKERILMDPPGGVNFAGFDVANIKPQKVKLTNNTDKPIKIEPAAEDQQHQQYKTAIEEIEPGKIYELSISPQPPFNEGSNIAQLKFRTGLPESPELIIPVRMYVPPELEVAPPEIWLGAPLAQPLPKGIQIKYNGQGVVKVTGAEATNPDIKIEVKERTAGKDYQVMAILPAGLQVPTDNSLVIKITTDSAKRPEIVVPIRTHGQPQPQQITAESLIGQRAPLIEVTSPTGVDRLGMVNGKVMVIDFWASWCKYCRRQLPMVQRLGNAYAAKGVDFKLVSADKNKSVQEVIEAAASHGATLPVLLDSQQTAVRAYGATGFPILLLVGKNGIIEAVHRGAGKDEAGLAELEKTISAQIDVLLEGKTRSDFPAKSAPPAEFTAAPAPDNVAPEAPKFVIESNQQDTGLHKPGADVAYNVSIRNGGRQALTISQITPSEGAQVADDFAKTLAPDATTQVKVSFKAPDSPGEFNRSLLINTNDPNNGSAVVVLTGTVRQLVEVDPPTGVDFSRRPRIHGMPRLATLTYNGTGEISFPQVESTSPKFRAEVQPIPGTPYSKVTVYANPPFDRGENNGTIKIHTSLAQQPVVEFPVTLYMPDRVEVMPAEVVLEPSRRLQQTTVQIVNNGEESFHVLGVAKSNDRLRTQFYPDSDGMSYRLQITFPGNYNPSGEGDKITITTDDSQYKEIVIPIHIRTGQAVSQAQPAQ